MKIYVYYQTFDLLLLHKIVNRPLYVFMILYTNASNEYISLFISQPAQLIATMYTLRMWLLFFDYKKRKALLAYKWQSQIRSELKFAKINDSYTMNTNNSNAPWILKHQHIFDNSTKMHILGVVIWILTVCCTIGSYYIHPNLFNIVQMVFLGLYVLALGVGYFQIHICHDQIHIKSFVFVFILILICF